MIRFNCLACGVKLRGKDDTVGKRIECPACGKTIKIPTPPKESDETDDEITDDEEQEEEDQPNKARLWYGIAAGFVFGLVVFTAALWAGGVFSRSNSNEQASSQRAKEQPKLNEKQKTAAVDALKGLERIKAAVEVGVNNRRYGDLVIEAKALVNEAERTLPECDLRSALTECMRAYQDNVTVWDHKIQYEILGLRKEYDGVVIARYNLPVKGEKEDWEIALQTIWAVAGKNLEKARSLTQ